MHVKHLHYALCKSNTFAFSLHLYNIFGISESATQIVLSSGSSTHTHGTKNGFSLTPDRGHGCCSEYLDKGLSIRQNDDR